MSVSAAAAEELRAFFARVRPDYRELFNMAHAICGNYETAEYAVQSAILQIYRGAGPVKSRMGLRESLRGAVRREAVSQTLLIGETELTWDGFCPDAIDGAQGDFILQAAAQEGVDARRTLMLRYGCGLRMREIVRLTGMTRAQAVGVCTRFERRVKRRLPPRDRARVESRIVRCARAWLARQSEGVPDPAAVYRSLEAELLETGAPGRRLSRALSYGLWAILALLLALLFWVVMVLLEPPRLEQPGEVAAVQTPAVQADFQAPLAPTQSASAQDASAQDASAQDASAQVPFAPVETAPTQSALEAQFFPDQNL